MTYPAVQVPEAQSPPLLHGYPVSPLQELKQPTCPGKKQGLKHTSPGPQSPWPKVHVPPSPIKHCLEEY